MDGLVNSVRGFLSTQNGVIAAVVIAVLVIGGGGAGVYLLTKPKPNSNSVAVTTPPSPSAGPSAKPTTSPSAATATPSTAPTTATGGPRPKTSNGPVAHPSPITTKTGFTYTPASLYSGAAATQGITASTLTLCMHAAISLGAAFNETAADVSVYWKYINAKGGIQGRQVNFSIQDDAYTAQGAGQAAANCQAANPFLIMGGIGFDQDPVVRQLAEQNKFIYLYTMADDGSQGSGAPKAYTYSFTAAPSIEQVGTWMGEATMKYSAGYGPYGAVYVKDANWIGGYNTYKTYLDSHGGNSVDNNSYTMNAGGDTSQFSAYITQLQTAGVKTVYLWMNALGADAFVSQAHQQGYNPAYVTPDGFDLVTGTVGESIDDGGPNPSHPAISGWLTPAFDPNNPNVPWWPQEKEMLDAYSQLDSGHIPDDIDWQAWNAFRSIKDMFDVCGPNCDRNDVVGMFNSGWSENLSPLCKSDFGPNHNFGGLAMNLWKAHRVKYISVDYPQASQHTVWQQIATCSNNFR